MKLYKQYNGQTNQSQPLRQRPPMVASSKRTVADDLRAPCDRYSRIAFSHSDSVADPEGCCGEILDSEWFSPTGGNATMLACRCSLLISCAEDLGRWLRFLEAASRCANEYVLAATLEGGLEHR